jgi:putative peptidoglycan lipid II flippase
MEENVTEKHQAIAKTSTLVILVSGLSRLFGFARETAVAYVFGVGAVTDAYAVAVRVVGTAGLLVSLYLTQIFIPTYVRALENDGEKKALKVANNALGISLVTSFAIMAVLYVTAPFILVITGFDAEHASLALTSVNIILLQLPLTAVVNFFIGYSTAKKSFLKINLIGFPMNMVVISLVLIFGTQSGVAGLSVAFLFGTLSQAIFSLIWLKTEKYRHGFSVNFKTPEIRNDIKLLLPALMSGAIYDLKAWVDTLIATYLGEGNAAAIGFAMRLSGLVQGLIVLPVANIIYSYMSEHAVKKDTQGMLDVLWKTTRVILFIILPITIIAIPSSFDVVSIAFQRGQFTSEATVLTGTALMWYLPGLLGASVSIFLFRLFFSLQDTKTPMIVGVIVMLINIALSIWLSNVMYIGGLALATSISSNITAVLLFIFIRKKIGPLGFKETATDIAKMAVCAIPCLAAAVGARHLLAGQHEIIRFGGSTIAGGALYLVSAFFLKTIVADDFIKLVKKLSD